MFRPVKNWILPITHYFSKNLEAIDKTIIICSDGVFEFLTSQAVVDIVAKYEDPSEAAHVLVSEAYKLWLQYEVDGHARLAPSEKILTLFLPLLTCRCAQTTSQQLLFKSVALIRNHPIQSVDEKDPLMVWRRGVKLLHNKADLFEE